MFNRIHSQDATIFMDGRKRERVAHYALDAHCPVCRAHPNQTCVKSMNPPVYYTRLEVHMERTEASQREGKALAAA